MSPLHSSSSKEMIVTPFLYISGPTAAISSINVSYISALYFLSISVTLEAEGSMLTILPSSALLVDEMKKKRLFCTMVSLDDVRASMYDAILPFGSSLDGIFVTVAVSASSSSSLTSELCGIIVAFPYERGLSGISLF